MAQRAKSVSVGYPVKVGNRYVSWYSYGHMCFDARIPLPPKQTCHPHLVQGYRRAAVERIAFELSSLREAVRRGKASFLPEYEHLASTKGE